MGGRPPVSRSRRGMNVIMNILHGSSKWCYRDKYYLHAALRICFFLSHLRAVTHVFSRVRPKYISEYNCVVRSLHEQFALKQPLDPIALGPYRGENRSTSAETMHFNSPHSA